MPLFGRSKGRASRRHTGNTDTTMTDGGYNNGGYNNNNGGYNNGVHNDGVVDGRHSHEMEHRKGKLGGRRNKPVREKGHKQKRPLFDIHSGYYNRRPSFGTWLKHTWLDILTMVIMGAIGLGVYMAPPAPSRSFPITFLDGTVVYPQFAYPLRKEIIPIWAAALLAALVPIFVFLCMQIRVRSFWDVNNAVIGLLYSLIGAAVFQVFIKWLIGGLRPHFLDVCAPDLTRVAAAASGGGFQNLMFTPDICTGDRKQINDSLESMPSGHSTAAWAGFLYLYFYLNAKLKVFSNHHPAMWKLVALYAPLLGATLITGALTVDEFHNWYDCLAGAIIGSVFAISAYRMVYASVWDFRFNHIPLTRHTPFSYGAGPAGAGGFESCVFTRKAGWGHEEAYGGAPFDSAFGLRGMGGSGGMGGAVVGNEQTVGLGHKNMGHRHGDIEHNAVGVGHNQHGHGTSLGQGVGHHHNNTVGHDTVGHNTLGHNNVGHNNVGHNTLGHNTVGHNTLGHNSTGYNTTGHSTVGNSTLGNSTVGHNTLGSNTVGHNTLGHNTHGHNTLGHNTLGHNDQGYNNYNTTHDHVTEPGMVHNSDLEREGRPTMMGGDNRYKSHRKSLERKAIAQQARNDGTY